MCISRSYIVSVVAFGLLTGCALKPMIAQDAPNMPALPAQGLEAQPAPIAANTAEDAAAQTAQTESERNPAALPLIPAPIQGDLYSVSSDPAYNMSCKELFDLMTRVQPTTVEETLKAIQQTRPKFLTRSVFAYETRMAFDGASLLYPRAIVYGGDAKMVLNFGGHNRQRGYDRMQTMCFDDAQAKFEFYDIAFPKETMPDAQTPPAMTLTPVAPTETASREPDAAIPAPMITPAQAAANSIALTAEEKAQKYVVIKGGRGVRTCNNCHSERAIRDTYNMWPGFYGAADDALKDSARFDARNYYNSFESGMWARFDSIPAKKGRYQYVSQELKRANSDFTEKLSYLNGRRIVGELKRIGPEFQKSRYEFAHALMCTEKAERRYFRQISGDTSVGATFPVMSENADVTTKELFLSAYFDERKKEDRLGAVMAGYGLPNPLPRERFEELRKYYRNIVDPTNELNLDMRLTAVDVDEVLLIRELKKVTDKLNVDIENWSMVGDGGYFHENGRGGDGRIALRLILEKPLMQEIFADDTKLTAAVQARQDNEQRHAPAEDIEKENQKICGLLKTKIN